MHILWIDCEFTGLRDNDHILEIAFILTDFSLKVIEKNTFVLSCTENILDSMIPFVNFMHVESGLLERVKKSTFTYHYVEDCILDILKKYTISKSVYIAGNSVYSDLYFLKKYMPKIVEWMHYRLIDISTLKILYQSVYPSEKWFFKKKAHRALDDIHESIEEFNFYKIHFLKML
jgi:oligoribonuclease